MTATVVWTEIPVTDLSRAETFYTTVFGWKMQAETTGPEPMLNFAADTGAIGGHLYVGKPGAGVGPTVHLALPDTVEAGMARCVAAGGALVSEVIAIPPGRFAYATDPDGNSIGLFEPRRG